MVWSGLLDVDRVLFACIRHYFPRQGGNIELRWRTSRESHPSEERSELQYRRIIVGWRDHGGDSLPRLPWSEWVSLCTLNGRPLMQRYSAQVVFAHSA